MPGVTKPHADAQFQFDDIEGALESFAKGDFLMVLDDENRENEGDLICAASLCTTEKMACGYVCISLPSARLEQLEIPMMVQNNQERHRTAYAVTVDYKDGKPVPRHFVLLANSPAPPGTTTGISAHDRALTARKLAHYSSAPLRADMLVNGPSRSLENENSNPPTPDSFSRPGHMVPLRARPGGVLKRKGHTEAALDLCIMTSLPPAGILCELVNDDLQGSMARRDDCRKFADCWGIKMISIEQLIQYRLENPYYESAFLSGLPESSEEP